MHPYIHFLLMHKTLLLQRPVSVFDEDDEEEFESFEGDSQWEVHSCIIIAKKTLVNMVH